MDIKPLIAAFVREIARFLGADPALVRATVNLADALTNDVTPGGPMPEPWPGMGATVDDEYRKGHTIVFSGYCYDLSGNLFLLSPNGTKVSADRIAAIYDGRRCIWRRNP